MIDISYSLNKNMISWPESKILRIYQTFHFDSKISCKPSVTVLILINGMSAIFQQGLKQVLRKHCNFIASSLEVVGYGSNEPVYSGLNEPVAAMEQHTMKQKKRGRPKAKQSIKQAKRWSSARNNKKRKQKDTKMDLSSDDDSSEMYCLVCVAAYSDSRPNEKWIQCTACKEWTHEKCINILHSGLFLCRNCDSDDSDFDY